MVRSSAAVHVQAGVNVAITIGETNAVDVVEMAHDCP